MNLSIPLLALVMANRMGDSSSDSGRAALLAMMIRPPMTGLLVAMLVAARKAQPKNALSTNKSGGQISNKGQQILNQVIPKADHSFFPTFMDLTRKEAAHLAKRLGLDVTFMDTKDGSGKDVVVTQDPKPGSNWPRNLTEVTLYLG